LVYKVLHGLVLQYLGPINYVTDLPGHRPLCSEELLYYYCMFTSLT